MFSFDASSLRPCRLENRIDQWRDRTHFPASVWLCQSVRAADPPPIVRLADSRGRAAQDECRRFVWHAYSDHEIMDGPQTHDRNFYFPTLKQ